VKTTFYPNKIFTFTSERNVAFDSEDREENPMYDREENPTEGIYSLPDNLEARVDDTAVFAYYSNATFVDLVTKTDEAAVRGNRREFWATYDYESDARFVWLLGCSADALVEAAEEEGAEAFMPLEPRKSGRWAPNPDRFLKGDDFTGLTELESARVRYMKGGGPFGYALILFDGFPREAKAFAEYLELLFGSIVDIYFVEGEDDSDFPEDPAPRSRREARDTGFKRTRRNR